MKFRPSRAAFSSTFSRSGSRSRSDLGTFGGRGCFGTDLTVVRVWQVRSFALQVCYRWGTLARVTRAPHALSAALNLLLAAAVTLTVAVSTADVEWSATHPVQSVVDPVWAAHEDECWQGGDEPLAVLPGAAVIHWSEGDTEYVTSRSLVSLAFDAVLGERSTRRFDVIGLCE